MAIEIHHVCRECGRASSTVCVDGEMFNYTCKTCVSKLATEHEPPPQAPAEQHPAMWDLVVADMQARDKVGEERYGTRLYPHNGRKSLVDCYQEALDLVVYLRQAIYEQEGK